MPRRRYHNRIWQLTGNNRLRWQRHCFMTVISIIIIHILKGLLKRGNLFNQDLDLIAHRTHFAPQENSKRHEHHNKKPCDIIDQHIVGNPHDILAMNQHIAGSTLSFHVSFISVPLPTLLSALATAGMLDATSNKTARRGSRLTATNTHLPVQKLIHALGIM